MTAQWAVRAALTDERRARRKKSLRQVWDRSLPRPVGKTGRRSVGNGKERLRDYAGFPDRQPSVPFGTSRMGYVGDFIPKPLTRDFAP